MQAGARPRRKLQDKNEKVGCPKGVESVQEAVQKDFWVTLNCKQNIAIQHYQYPILKQVYDQYPTLRRV